MRISNRILENRIVRRLAAHPYVDTGRVSVRVRNGTAHLTGSVQNEFERSCAVETTASLLGVAEAVDHLQIVGSAPRLALPSSLERPGSS